MGRISTVKQLAKHCRDRLDTIIREQNYCHLDAMLKLVRAEGILLSRTALHRYVQNLVQLDGVKVSDENITVVVIVSRATGRTLATMTPASPAQVEAAISKLGNQ